MGSYKGSYREILESSMHAHYQSNECGGARFNSRHDDWTNPLRI